VYKWGLCYVYVNNESGLIVKL